MHVLSQFMQSPLQQHWTAALRVVRYLKGCSGQGILLRSKSSLWVTAFCDSDWAACPLTRHFFSAYIVLLDASPISWKTKKHPTISLSFVEAEYRSIAFALRELKWIKQLLLSFGITHNEPMKIFCDSQSAIHITVNPVFYERTKHIKSDYHWVHDAVQDKLTTTEHISSKELIFSLRLYQHLLLLISFPSLGFKTSHRHLEGDIEIKT